MITPRLSCWTTVKHHVSWHAMAMARRGSRTPLPRRLHRSGPRSPRPWRARPRRPGSSCSLRRWREPGTGCFPSMLVSQNGHENMVYQFPIPQTLVQTINVGIDAQKKVGIVRRLRIDSLLRQREAASASRNWMHGDSIPPVLLVSPWWLGMWVMYSQANPPKLLHNIPPGQWR